MSLHKHITLFLFNQDVPWTLSSYALKILGMSVSPLLGTLVSGLATLEGLPPCHASLLSILVLAKSPVEVQLTPSSGDSVNSLHILEESNYQNGKGSEPPALSGYINICIKFPLSSTTSIIPWWPEIYLIYFNYYHSCPRFCMTYSQFLILAHFRIMKSNVVVNFIWY